MPLITSQDPAPASFVQVSLVVSIYRQPVVWVEQCLNSCLGQSHADVEVLVRLDGPEAADVALHALLDSLAAGDARLRWWQGHQRLGTFGSYRRLMAASGGDWLAQVDADDWLAPRAVERCLAACQFNPAAGMVYSRFSAVDAKGRPLQPPLPPRPPYSQMALLAGLMTFHLRLIRRSAYQAVGGYRPGYQLAGDYDLCLRLSELFEVVHIPEPLYFYRLHKTNTFLQRAKALTEEAATAVRAAMARREGYGHMRLRVVWPSGRHRLENHGVSLSASPIHEPSPGLAGVVVTGMHRSRTSMLAKELFDGGYQMGESLLAGDRNNPWGYFEDLDFLHLASGVLRGWRRLGWPGVRRSLTADWLRGAGLSVDTTVLEEFSCQAGSAQHARQLYERRAFLALAAGQPWGWKDPRAALMLNAWKRVAPDLKVVAVIRPVNDVVASLRRWDHPDYRGCDQVFSDLWMLYNRAILRFFACYPHDVILLDSDHCYRQEPGWLLPLLRNRWGALPARSQRQVYSELLGQQGFGARLLRLVERARTPEELYALALMLIHRQALGCYS